MPRSKYHSYAPLLEGNAKAMRRDLKSNKELARVVLDGKRWKDATEDDWLKAALSMIILDAAEQDGREGASMLLDKLFEDWCWSESGRHIYFPLPGLLESLYSAKMEVDVEDFSFPRQEFSLAVPAGERIGGLRLPGFLVVSHMNPEYRRVMKDRFFDAMVNLLGVTREQAAEMFGVDKSEVDWGQASLLQSPVFSITYSNPHGEELDIVSCGRTSAGKAGLEGLLRNLEDESMDAVIPPDGAPPVSNAEQLAAWQADKGRRDDNRKAVYRLVRSVVHLVVYMRAYPESVVDGYPESLDVQALRMSKKKLHGHVIGGQHFKGTHASPKGHWRRWHFRSYPRRPDGTKKEGLVAVRATMVNPRETPHVIKEVDDVSI
jgi:hypothetical protein